MLYTIHQASLNSDISPMDFYQIGKKIIEILHKLLENRRVTTTFLNEVSIIWISIFDKENAHRRNHRVISLIKIL